ncbi:amino acid ABC transporter ATP-binding protein [Actinokineospora cianjurensis]|uniref:ABC-type polar-amino-acid transporter n=1 Tax=Actinokineospora cianjurensis TaxID=585224 RepID=A0A421AW80_9PSEU|nr:amino acid ABC transporter ATP-binding protein [Actinokineospora cianjurensis]RLK54006.1 amino acid ABC transporter ATP-binding protein (PAAT family) [Actinokineospora cianjurensis]
MGETVLRLRDVHKSYGRQEVLRGIDLDVAEGEVVCLLGPSGSGKSTLLRTINHLEPLDRGAVFLRDELIGYRESGGRLVELGDRELAGQRARFGMVFQGFNLFPHMTVLENVVEAPIRVRRESVATARTRAVDLLTSVGLADRADAYPRHLSGGQQQRVAIARALAMSPAVLLFDEPTSALDPELVGEVLDVMRHLAAGGMTMLVVTHEITFARDVADRAVFLDHGTIIEQGPAADVLERPRERRTREFLTHVR